MDERCDRRVDCEDASDEQNCDIVEIEDSYNRLITPISDNKYGTVLVNITIDIEDILNIDEVKEIFLVKFSLTRDWKDNRLTFLNLNKNSSDLNALTSEEADTLWYPSFDINNIENKKMFTQTSIDQVQVVIPNENFSYESGDITHERNMRIFKGSENVMSLRRQWSVKFICHYQTTMYPFDTQLCRMEFLVGSNFVRLNPTALFYDSRISLNRQFVREVKMCRTKVAKKQAIVVEVTLGRPLISNILTVFIPTSILMVISNIAGVFEEHFMDMVIEVNLTVLLVQATL